MWGWRRMERIKWSEKVANEKVLERIGEKRMFINNILRRKPNWIGHILRRNCLLYDAIEGQLTGLKGLVRRRTHFHDDLRDRRIHWELKQQAEDQQKLKLQFINYFLFIILFLKSFNTVFVFVKE